MHAAARSQMWHVLGTVIIPSLLWLCWYWR